MTHRGLQAPQLLQLLQVFQLPQHFRIFHAAGDFSRLFSGVAELEVVEVVEVVEVFEVVEAVEAVEAVEERVDVDATTGIDRGSPVDRQKTRLFSDLCPLAGGPGPEAPSSWPRQSADTGDRQP